MIDSNVRMIEAQAARITKQNMRIMELQKEIDGLHNLYNESLSQAKCWTDMVAQIIDNPMLQGEWENFLLVLKLAADGDYIRKNGG
jgi:hypothetical protein